MIVRILKECIDLRTSVIQRWKKRRLMNWIAPPIGHHGSRDAPCRTSPTKAGGSDLAILLALWVADVELFSAPTYVAFAVSLAGTVSTADSVASGSDNAVRNDMCPGFWIPQCVAARIDNSTFF